MITMQREGPIITEPQYICDVCGKKKPVSQMAGKCVRCGKYVCHPCSRMKRAKVYCRKCARPCFIATAAFGSVMAREIDILREFRDTKLEPNVICKQLVRLYYTVSPPLANAIARSEGMKALVRLFLKPFIRALNQNTENTLN